MIEKLCPRCGRKTKPRNIGAGLVQCGACHAIVRETEIVVRKIPEARQRRLPL